jgi:hypothetical protein
MENSCETEGRSDATWESLMRQVADCKMPYERALSVALGCVEVTERYSFEQPRTMSPAAPDAELNIMTNLATPLECDVRLAVYSLYHGDQLVEHDRAVEQLIECGKRSDSPE